MLLEYAKKELESAGYFTGDEGNALTVKCVLELIEVFENQNHSGFSAPFIINLFQQLASYQPITELTGLDDEWVEVTDNVYQNKRCYSVFKENNIAYDIDGFVFLDKDGVGYTNSKSRRIVEFPYFPKTEYVPYKEEEVLNA